MPSGLRAGVSPEAHIRLCRSLVEKNEHMVSKHLGSPVALERQHQASGPDSKTLHFPDGVISAAMISMGPSGCDFARDSHKDLMILERQDCCPIPTAEEEGAQVDQAWGDQGRIWSDTVVSGVTLIDGG